MLQGCLPPPPPAPEATGCSAPWLLPRHAPGWPYLILQMKPEVRIFVCYLPVLQCWQSLRMLKNTVRAKLTAQPRNQGRGACQTAAGRFPVAGLCRGNHALSSTSCFFSIKIEAQLDRWKFNINFFSMKNVNTQKIRVCHTGTCTYHSYLTFI